MKVIPAAVTVVAVTGLIALSGCTRRVTADADGALCGTQAGTGPVYVDISYAVDGTPKASPEDCQVKVGTVITWRDPPDRTTQFNLVFSTASPGGPHAPLQVAAASVDNRYKVSITAQGAPGKYKYGIQANGRMIDPAIIIDR